MKRKRIEALLLSLMIGATAVVTPDMTAFAAEPSNYATTENSNEIEDEEETSDDAADEGSSEVSVEEEKSVEETEPADEENIEGDEEVTDEAGEEASEDIKPETEDEELATAGSDFQFTVENNEAILTKYIGEGGDIVIPDSVGGANIVAIKENAFKENDTITSVKLPANLRSIGAYAFYECSNIESVEFNEGLTTTGKYSFGYCTSLKEINLPKSLETLGDQVFGFCEGATKVFIPKSLGAIELAPFKGCSALKTVVFEDGITSIPSTKRSSFYDDGGLFAYSGIEEIVLPDTIETIGANAFYGCSKLESVSFGKGLKTVGDRAFKKCTSLKKAIFPEGTERIGEYSFIDCTSLNEIYLPAGLLSAGIGAFKGTTALKKVTFEDGTETIFGQNPIYEYEGIFGGSGIESITIPGSVKKIEACAFGNCAELKTISLTGNITEIGQRAFYGCKKLETIVLPDDITRIQNQTFEGCSSLNNVLIPAKVETIGEKAFNGCSSLESVVFPVSVTSVGNSAYAGCSSLAKVFFETDNLYKKEQTLGEGVFSDCTKLVDVQLGNRITKLPKKAFAGCYTLPEIQIPHGVKTIPAGAFAKCQHLQYMFVPASVKTFETTDTEFERSYDHVPTVYVEKGSVTTAGVNAAAMGWNVKVGIWNVDINDKTNNEFPDKNFNSQLFEQRIDKNIDTRLTLREIEAVNTLDLSGKDIADIKGLELLTKIENLDISDNSIESLFVTDIPSSESYFALENLVKLRVLDCSNNKISYLDMSGNSDLTKLNCDGNRILALDLEENTALEDLTVGEQEGIVSVESNDYFDHLLDLKTVYGDQYKKSSLTDIIDAYFGEGEEAKTEIEGITWDEAYDVPDSMSYKYAVGYGSGASKTMIVSVVIKNAGLENTSSELAAGYPDGNFRTALFAALDKNKNNLLSRTEERSATELNVSGKEIESLAGIERLWNLEILDFGNNKITSVDLNDNLELKVIYAGGNALAALNIESLEKLETLRAGKQAITLEGTLAEGYRTLDMRSYDPDFDKDAVSSVKAFDGKGKEIECDLSVTEDGFSFVDVVSSLEYVWATGSGNMTVTVTIPGIGADCVRVELNPMGGKIKSSYVVAKKKGTYSQLPVPEREGYVFDGWFTEEYAGKEVKAGNKIIKNIDHTLYAHWHQIQYSVRFDSKQSVIKLSDDTVTFSIVVSPEGADKNITWKSSDESVLKVSGNTTVATVTPVSEGKAVVTATTSPAAGERTVSLTVTVIKDDNEEFGDTPTQATAASKEAGGIWVGNLDVSGYTYTGNAITPQIRVYDGYRLLKAGTDYKLSYKNNKAANKLESAAEKKKAPTVTVKFTGSYSGSLSETFKINPLVLTDELVADGTITADNLSVMVKRDKKGQSKVQKVKPVIYYSGKKLAEKKDYTLDYTKAVAEEGSTAFADPGSYDIVVAAKSGNYTGSFTVKETICENSETATYTSVADKKITAKFENKSVILGQENKLTVMTADNKELVDGKEINVSIVGGNKVGTATCVITGNPSEGYFGKKTLTYKVTAIPAANLTAEVGEAVILKGGSKPAVTVKYITGEGENKTETVLKEGVDYKLSYSSNTSVTKKGKVKVTGIGNYKGSTTAYYDIKTQDIGKLYVYADNVAYSKKADAYKKVKVIVRDLNGKDLKLNTDYQLIVASESEKRVPGVGETINITVKGKGNYNGEAETSVPVTDPKTSISKAKITFYDTDGTTKLKSFAYTGYAVEPENFKLTIGSGSKMVTLDPSSYEVVGYVNNTAKGKATMTVRGAGGYGGLVNYSFTIGSKKTN